MKKTASVAVCAAATLLPLAGIIGCASLLMKRRPIEELYEMRKAQDDFVSLQDLPERLIHFTVESEDPGFFTHGAFCWERIRDAMQVNREAGKIAVGGSTITQQLHRRPLQGRDSPARSRNSPARSRRDPRASAGRCGRLRFAKRCAARARTPGSCPR